MGGQTRNIAIQFVSQQLQTKLHVFVIRFTVALVNKQICANAHLTENLSVAVERSSDQDSPTAKLRRVTWCTVTFQANLVNSSFTMYGFSSVYIVAVTF